MGLTLSAFADEIDGDLQIAMDVLEQYGISKIDIRTVQGKPITDYTLREVAEIKAKLDKRRFRVAAVGSSVGRIPVSDDFAGHTDVFKKTLDIAGILETRRIRMFSFLLPGGSEPSAYRDVVLERWRTFLDISAERDVLLMHENKPMTYGDTSERCLDLMTALKTSRVACVFDPANFVLSGQDVYAAWRMLKPYVAAVHIKDASAADGHIEPAGVGDGALSRILADCIRSGFTGILTLEPHLSGFSGMEHLDFGYDLKTLPEGGSRFDIAVTALIQLLNELHFDPAQDPFKTGAPV